MTRPTAPVTTRLLTVKDVAEALQLSTRTVRRMIASKQIPIIRLGRSVRVHPSAIYDLYNKASK
jgi:excisionase family DNA binding protein